MKAHLREHAVAYMLLAVAAFVRFPFLAYDAPFVYDPDEPVPVRLAIMMLRNQDLNPHWFGWPGSTTVYPLTVIYALYYVWGRAIGRFTSPDDFRIMFHQDPSVLYVMGRALGSVFALGCVYLAYQLGRRLHSNWVGWLAAGVMAFSPELVHYSLLTRVDLNLTFFLLATTWFCLDITEQQGKPWRAYTLAGAMIGLAVQSKYTGTVYALVVVWTHWLAYRWRRLPLLLAGAAGAVVAAFVTGPYLFLDFAAVLQSVANENESYHLSAAGRGMLGNLFGYLVEATPLLVGWPVAVLAAWGVIAGGWWRRPAWTVVPAGLLVFTLFLSSLRTFWVRWYLPMAPFWALLAGLAMVRSAEWIETRRGSRSTAIVRGLVTLGLLLSIAVPSAIWLWDLRNPHPRTLAREWILANVPTGSRILLEGYTVLLPFGRYEAYQVVSVPPEGGAVPNEVGEPQRIGTEPQGCYTNFEATGSIGYLRDPDELERLGIEYIVLGVFQQLYEAERERHGDVVRRYKDVLSRARLVFEAQGGYGRAWGSIVRVYRVERT
jgi:4-amino-4-deoxy-L-arabinose transferase-like glycosyltransferase